MAEWTIEDVAERFDEAVRTGRKLPRVQVQGYFNVWPAFARDQWEAMGSEPVPCRFPPEPQAIDRMMEVMRWMQWLEQEQRHLIWMRARQFDWKSICRRFGCDRSTAWRRWQRALSHVMEKLNEGAPIGQSTIDCQD